MTRGKPFRVRCHRCTVKPGATKQDGYNLVRTGKEYIRSRTFKGDRAKYKFHDVKCLDCGAVFESRLSRAAMLPLEKSE
jgi:hypothetical protein